MHQFFIKSLSLHTSIVLIIAYLSFCVYAIRVFVQGFGALGLCIVLVTFSCGILIGWLGDGFEPYSPKSHRFYWIRRLFLFGQHGSRSFLSALAQHGYSYTKKDGKTIIFCCMCGYTADLNDEIWQHARQVQSQRDLELKLPAVHSPWCRYHYTRNDYAKAVHSLIYHPLDEKRREIRLVILEPGGFQDDLMCHLEAISLDTFPAFEALSYCWDYGRLAESITIEGHRVLKSAALSLILKRLRSSTMRRKLWIDALCINQLDLHERSQQVSLMPNIYSSSSNCLIWLGDTDLRISMAFQDLNSDPLCKFMAIWKYAGSDEINVHEFLEKHWSLTRRSKDPSGIPTPKSDLEAIQIGFTFIWLLSENKHLHEMPFFQSKCGGIQHADIWPDILDATSWIMSDKWWNRAWIVQEALLSPHAAMFAGPILMPFTILQSANLNFSQHLKAGCCADVLRSLPKAHIRMLQNMWEPLEKLMRTKFESMDKQRNVRLSGLLQTFRHRKATDPRDKIYALLGLAKAWDLHHGETLPEADYSLSVAEVYAQAALKIIQLDRDFDILTRACRQTNPHYGLPSWVPDWTATSHRLNKDLHDVYNVSGGIFKPPILIHRGLLTTNCAYDMIYAVTTPFDRHRDSREKVEILSFWMTIVGLDVYSESKTTLGQCRHCGDLKCNLKPLSMTWETFWTALTGGYMTQRQESGHISAITPENIELLTLMWDWARLNRTDFTDDLVPEQFRSCYKWLHDILDANVLFITCKGHLGVGPRGSQVGDEVRILIGARMPFVFRRLTELTPNLNLVTRTSSPPSPNRTVKTTDGDRSVCVTHGNATTAPIIWCQKLCSDGTEFFEARHQDIDHIRATCIINVYKGGLPLNCDKAQAVMSAKVKKHFRQPACQSLSEWFQCLRSLSIEGRVNSSNKLVWAMPKFLISGVMNSKQLVLTPVRQMIGPAYINGIMDGEVVANLNFRQEDMLII